MLATAAWAAEPYRITTELQGAFADLHCGDLNGDGFEDIAGSAVQVLGGKGGLDRAIGMVPEVPVLLLADVDGDGRDEIVTSEGIDELGEETPRWAFASPPQWATVADVDGDDALELLLAESEAALSWVDLPLADGALLVDGALVGEPGEEYFPQGVSSIGDLDGDGYGDVATMSVSEVTNGPVIRILRGSPGGLVRAWDGPDEGVYWPAHDGPGDADGDGFDDLVTDLAVYRGGPDGPSRAPGLLVPGWPVGFTDLDLDGYGDLLVLEPDEPVLDAGEPTGLVGSIALYPGSPEGPGRPRRFSKASADHSFAISAVPCDVDGNGVDDLVVGAPDRDDLAPGELWVFPFDPPRGGGCGCATPSGSPAAGALVALLVAHVRRRRAA